MLEMIKWRISQYGDYAAGRTAKELWLDFQQSQNIFLVSKAPMPAVGSTYNSIQWYQGVRQRIMKLNTQSIQLRG